VLLTLLKEMASHKETAFLVGPLQYQKTPLVELIEPMMKQGQQYTKLVTGKSGKTTPEAELAELIVQTYSVLNKALAHAEAPASSKHAGAEGEAEVKIGGVADEWQDAAREYKETLEPLRLDELDDEAFEGHHYPRPSDTQSATKLHRVAGEVITMGTSLPVEFQGMSVFVRAHEERMDWIKVMIIGPEGTPYEDGCFEFHVALPSNYPWRGAAGENWNADTSSLSQLFISIAAIVMTDDPYFNEPGCEREAGTPDGQARNQGYANIVRWGTVKYAMLDQLKNPSKGFEDVIRNHFRIKKEKVLRTTGKWTEDSKRNSPPAQYTGHTQSHNQSTAAKFANGKYSEMLIQEVRELEALLDTL